MNLDPGMHIVMHLVIFGKTGVTRREENVAATLGRPRRGSGMRLA
jgi:hypothetical protein